MRFSCDIFTILTVKKEELGAPLSGLGRDDPFIFRVRMLKRAEIRGIRKLESSAV